MVLPWFYHGFTYWYVFFYHGFYHDVRFFFRCSNMFDQFSDFERTCLCNLFDFVCGFIEWMRVVVIHIFISGFGWKLQMNTESLSLYTSYIYIITATTSINCIVFLSLSQVNHYYLVDKILLSPCQPCLLSQPTHPRYPPVNSNGWFEHICHKTSLSIYLLPVCVST
jgi:hypothetical protein